MRCLGLTKKIKRCKNNCNYLYCKSHRFQLITFFVSFLGVISLFYGSFKDFILPSILDNKQSFINNQVKKNYDKKLSWISYKYKEQLDADDVFIYIKDINNETLYTNDSISFILNKFEPGNIFSPIILLDLVKDNYVNINDSVFEAAYSYKNKFFIKNSYIEHDTLKKISCIDAVIKSNNSAIVRISEKYNKNIINLLNKHDIAIHDNINRITKKDNIYHSIGYNYLTTPQKIINAYSNIFNNKNKIYSQNEIDLLSKLLNYTKYYKNTNENINEINYECIKYSTTRINYTDNLPAYSSSLICTFPIYNPKYIIYIYVGNPSLEKSYFGANVSHKVLKSLFLDIDFLKK